LTIGSERIAAVSFNPELVSLPSTPAIHAVLQLSDGSRLTASACELREDALQVMLPFGAEIAVPLEAVLALQCYSDQVVAVSSFPVANWEFEAYVPSRLQVEEPEEPAPANEETSLLGRANPAWNRSALGGALRIRGVEFPRGLGLRPRARLTIDLDGRFQVFQSVVGVDDRANGRGSIEFRVESEGETLWAGPIVTGSQPPLDTGRIDIEGRDRLTLIVDFAEWGDLHDLAAWGNPILIRRPVGD
jgi:hypothetical protein